MGKIRIGVKDFFLNMVKQRESPIEKATQAAASASSAAVLAAEAARASAHNAEVASKAATDAATAIAVVGTDITWMKKTLCNIEETLKNRENVFITNPQHAEVVKVADDHEGRLKGLERNCNTVMVMLSVGIGILSLETSLLIWHLVGK